MHIKNTMEEFIAVVSRMLADLEQDTELAPLEQCNGRVLAGDIAAGENIPGFDSSTAEGFAVRAADTAQASVAAPIMLANIGDVLPGRQPRVRVGANQCAYIPVGGAVPAGADSVVQSGNASIMGSDISTIYIDSPHSIGDNIAPAAMDMVTGHIALTKGTVLAARSIAILAAMGISKAPVYRRPVAGILSIGNHLSGIDTELSGAMLRDSNTYMLQSLLGSSAMQTKAYGHVKADRRLVDRLLAKMCGQCNAIIISGDHSCIELDEKSSCLSMLGNLSILASKLGDVPIFLLPALPQQAYFAYRVMLEPCLNLLAGEIRQPEYINAALSNIPSKAVSGIVPVSVRNTGGTHTATPFDISRSTTLSMLNMDGYVIIDENVPFAEGDVVTVHMFKRR